MREDSTRPRTFARRMRTEPTPAQRHLWRIVRNRRLAAFKLRRRHPLGPYILDCYCPAAGLDGDSHTTDEGRTADAERTAYPERRGSKVLRFWNIELAENEDGVVTRICDECATRTTPETP